LHLPEVLASFRAGGVHVVEGPAEGLAYRSKKLFMSGEPIDVVMVAHWGPLLKYGANFPIFRALRDGSARVFNGLSSTVILGNKILFCLLSDRRYHTDLEPEVAAALARHVPWTRTVEECKSTDGSGG